MVVKFYFAKNIKKSQFYYKRLNWECFGILVVILLNGRLKNESRCRHSSVSNGILHLIQFTMIGITSLGSVPKDCLSS